jgi:hypothetical protein
MRRGRFGVLFWLLVVALALPVAVPDGPLIQRAMSVLLFIVMLSGLNAISNRRRELIIGIFLALPAVVLNWLGIARETFGLYVASQYLYLVFFAYLGIVLLRWTLREHEVDLETISGAVSVYLLMALVWGLAYYTIALTSPGSFHFPDEALLGQVQSVRAAGGVVTADPRTENWKDLSDSAQGTMMYYSFVTLTTLGYGDIYPTGDATRILAMLEATLGQLYLVILVARLVGLFTAQEAERRKKATPP